MPERLGIPTPLSQGRREGNLSGWSQGPVSLGRDFFTVPEGSDLEVWPQHILGPEVKCNYGVLQLPSGRPVTVEVSLGKSASFPLPCPCEGHGKEPWVEPSPTPPLPVRQWITNFSGSHPPCLYFGAAPASAIAGHD